MRDCIGRTAWRTFVLAAAGLIAASWIVSCTGTSGGASDVFEDSGDATNAPVTGDSGRDGDADATQFDDGPYGGDEDTGVDIGGEDGGTDGGDPCAPVTKKPPLLTPDRIAFTEVDPPMSGSFIYLTVWGAEGTDSIEMLSPDGLVSKTRFKAARIWTMGAASDGRILAFSSTDPDQEKNYGVTIGDAIQYTWILEPGKQPRQITNGNINDECLNFIDGDGKLLFCRRAGFFQCQKGANTVWGNDPYRILTVDVATGVENFISGVNPDVMEIGPQLRSDGTIIYWRNELKGGKFVQSLMKMEAGGIGIEYIHEGWAAPRLSRDKTQVLFRAAQGTQLMLCPAGDFASPKLVVDGNGARLVKFDFSPDMKNIVYSKPHPSANCDDIYTARLPDGAEQTLILDCVSAGKYIVGLQWVETK